MSRCLHDVRFNYLLMTFSYFSRQIDRVETETPHVTANRGSLLPRSPKQPFRGGGLLGTFAVLLAQRISTIIVYQATFYPNNRIASAMQLGQAAGTSACQREVIVPLLASRDRARQSDAYSVVFGTQST